jgi:hypothetical protein
MDINNAPVTPTGDRTIPVAACTTSMTAADCEILRGSSATRHTSALPPFSTRTVRHVRKRT